MLKLYFLLSIVSVGLSQWVDPDWSFWKNQHQVSGRYPPLPDSILINEAPSSSTPVTTSASTGTTQTTTPIPTSASTQAPSTCTSMFSCASCDTAQVCAPTLDGGLKPVYTLPCPTSAPYCDYSTGSCSTIPDQRCGASDNFLCPGNGYYPDATNCTVYHVCNNLKPQKFSCVDGQNYDADATECSPSVSCSTANCAGRSDYKENIGDSHYYTYCSGGNALIVSRCPDIYKLNVTSQNCEPICERDGLLTDLQDCTKYYKCSKLYLTSNFSVPIRENLPCPAGEAFAPDSYQCLPQSMTSCKQ